MPENIWLDNSRSNTDLNVYHCGGEECSPGHSWGPGVRDHYLIHYILKGKGIFQVNDKTYNLETGQGFLICPGRVSFYKADFEDPWEYRWVGFNGFKAETYLKKAGLTVDSPVFIYKKDDFLNNIFEQMLASKKLSEGREIKLVGLLYIFLSRIIENAGNDKKKESVNGKYKYVKKAVEYIERNYSRKIKISEIAEYIGLDRSYFYSIFKEKHNISPQEFLINFRLDKASELLVNTDLAIGDIARSVGYENPLTFSRIFKKKKDISPSDYRNYYMKSKF